MKEFKIGQKVRIVNLDHDDLAHHLYGHEFTVDPAILVAFIPDPKERYSGWYVTAQACEPVEEEKSDKLQLKVKRMYLDVQMPEYTTAGAACFDIRAYAPTLGKDETISFNHSHIFNTGLKVEVPEDHVMLIFSRSGQGFNNDVRLANAVGVLDSDYRGEIKVKLTTDGAAYKVAHGDRIAQAMVIPVKQVQFVEAELSETGRGEGGFGSSGVK